MTGVAELDVHNAASASVGVMMILMALVFKYGAELNEAKREQSEEPKE